MAAAVEQTTTKGTRDVQDPGSNIRSSFRLAPAALRQSNCHSFARPLADAPIAVLHGRIEIDGVPGFEREIFISYLNIQRAAQQVKELNSGMVMGFAFLGGQVLKLRQKSIELAVGSLIVEAFKEIRDVPGTWLLRKAKALLFADHRHHTVL